MNALAWIQGRICSPQEARVSVFDRGFLFGDGVYETGRSAERCLLHLDEHWKRLRRSAERLAIPVPWSDEQLGAGLVEVARHFGKPDLYFRTIVTRGVVEAVGLEVAAVTEPTLVHLVQDLAASLSSRASGIRLMTSSVQRISAKAQDPNIKSSNYLNSLLALQDARKRGGDDAILCDQQGRVAEGTTFSLFGVTEDDRLLTPSLEVGILDSITRRHVLRLAKPEIKVEEGFFSVEELQNCREVFVVSSVRDLVPARSWDGKTYSLPGKLTETLYERFLQERREYIAGHAKY